MTALQPLTGKYFITGALIPAGMPNILTRGKILGPVNDFAMHYLVEIYPLDSAKLTARCQVVYGLDALARPDIYLYDDKEIWELEFAKVYDGVQEMQKHIAARMEMQRRHGVVAIVDPDEAQRVDAANED